MSGSRSIEQFLSGSPRKRLIKYELVVYKVIFLMADWDYVMMLCLTQQYCIRCVSAHVLCARINLFAFSKDFFLEK